MYQISLHCDSKTWSDEGQDQQLTTVNQETVHMGHSLLQTSAWNLSRWITVKFAEDEYKNNG